MGGYDTSGLPSYLSTPDNISQNLSEFIDTLLPNGVNLVTDHPELFQGYQNEDINITQSSQVSVTYLSQTCVATNALGYYTYSTGHPPLTGDDIKAITYIYPNTGPQTPLQQGDKVVLGKFNPGTTIGFVLMVGAWDKIQHKLYGNVVHYYTDDNLNPETDSTLRKHAVMISYAAENKTIIGFEDTNRQDPACDNDFNDVVFYYTVTPSP